MLVRMRCKSGKWTSLAFGFHVRSDKHSPRAGGETRAGRGHRPKDLRDRRLGRAIGEHAGRGLQARDAQRASEQQQPVWLQHARGEVCGCPPTQTQEGLILKVTKSDSIQKNFKMDRQATPFMTMTSRAVRW